MGGFAWVTLATNDSYSLGALVLAHSLKKVNTAHQLVIMITPGVSEAMRTQLSAVFNVVKLVDVLDSQDQENLALLARPELGITFTKLHCWKLTQFDKCVFLDADTIVLQNSDELFEREELSAAPDVGWPDCFNSGVFVFRPSEKTFKDLIDFALVHGTFDGGDQGLLNLFFSDWATKDIAKHLPFVYNVVSSTVYTYLPAFKQFKDKLKIIHFIGSSKPWLQPFDTETGIARVSSDAQAQSGFIQLWWDLFCGYVHPTLTSSMAGLAGALSNIKLGAPRSEEETALQEHLRRQGWEEGNIDYMGRDSFDNIWKKICQTLASASSPPPPATSAISEAPSAPLPEPTPEIKSSTTISTATLSEGTPIPSQTPIPITTTQQQEKQTESEPLPVSESSEKITQSQEALAPEPTSKSDEKIQSPESIKPLPAESVPAPVDKTKPTELTPISSSDQEKSEPVTPSSEISVKPSDVPSEQKPETEKTKTPATAELPQKTESASLDSAAATTPVPEAVPSPPAPVPEIKPASAPAPVAPTSLPESVPPPAAPATPTPLPETVPPPTAPVPEIKSAAPAAPTPLPETVPPPTAPVPEIKPSVPAPPIPLSKAEPPPSAPVPETLPAESPKPSSPESSPTTQAVATPITPQETLPAASPVETKPSPPVPSQEQPPTQVTAVSSPQPAQPSSVPPTTETQSPKQTEKSELTPPPSPGQPAAPPSTPVVPPTPSTPIVTSPTPPTSPGATAQEPLSVASKLKVEAEIPSTPPVPQTGAQPTLPGATADEPPVPPKRKGGKGGGGAAATASTQGEAAGKTQQPKGGKGGKGKK